MPTAKNYLTDTATHMEYALRQMPLAVLEASRPLPTTIQEITRYVELLLTPEEQRMCDMATD